MRFAGESGVDNVAPGGNDARTGTGGGSGEVALGSWSWSAQQGMGTAAAGWLRVPNRTGAWGQGSGCSVVMLVLHSVG
jgi:hypothetical protein